MSPRGVLALQRIVRAHAAAEGRRTPRPTMSKSSPGTSSPTGCSSHPRVACEARGRSTSLRRFSTAFPSPPRQGLTCRPAPAGAVGRRALFVVSGRLFGAIEFLVVGIAAVTAVVVAVLLRQLRPSRLSVVRQLTPPLVPVGEPARVDLEVINRSRSRSPFCDCSTPLPEPEVSISRSRRSPATVRCTAPTVCPPPVEGCSISDPSGSTMSKDSGSHASGTASTPGFG